MNTWSNLKQPDFTLIQEFLKLEHPEKADFKVIVNDMDDKDEPIVRMLKYKVNHKLIDCDESDLTMSVMYELQREIF